MNANLKGNLYVRADRINERIRRASELMSGDVPHEIFLDFIKTCEIIVNDELVKGGSREWKKSLPKLENLNNACLQASTKEPTNWLKTLMMKLHLWK